MLKFSFELDKNIPQKDESRYDAYSKGFIEGEVTIYAGDSVLFQKVMHEGCRAWHLFRTVDGASATRAECTYEL